MNVRGGQATGQQGLGDGLSQALELVAAPVLFGLLGHWLDGRLGTRPWLLMTFGVLAFVGALVSASYEYLARCAREEEGKPWARRQP